MPAYSDGPRVFDRDAVIAALAPPALLAALQAAIGLQLALPLRHMNEIGPGHTQLLMPAWQRQSGFGGVKISNLVPGNAAHHLPTAHASYLLYDNVTGAHLALLDAAAMTARRTAAVSALAAGRLAATGARSMLLLGAGRIAAQVPQMFRHTIGIDSVCIHNRSPATARRLAAHLDAAGFTATVTDDLATAVARADVIVSTVPSETPALRGAWLRPGQHVDLIGSYKPHMREVDDDAILRSRVFVDTLHALEESGDLIGPLQRGVIVREHILGTLFDLYGEDGPERSPTDITLFKNAGSAWADLVAALLVWRGGVAATTPTSGR